MASLVDRLRDRTGSADEQPRVLEMTDADADEVLDALATETRRRTFRALFDRPATTSELADRLDTSVQNVHHHLSELEETGLVEPIDTVYSEKGNEMTVYGPASDPIIFVGDGDRVPRVRRSLSNVVGGLGLLAAASLLVQWAGERLVRARLPADDIGPASYSPADPTAPETLAWLLFEVLEPGLVFFLGCLVVAGVATLVADR
ncbi:ArsR/SmtB family transcription factor [Halorussus caseinilyticus]|uniref:ArsR/SmtB family transcription factor n=1 Tax=Halorussus caseinilyticus TaxID=3034025 RepID=A0ABD5WNU0_9EURY|nr:helix-turn-helix domain-containing protein [Halorussus sp. DT72]